MISIDLARKAIQDGEIVVYPTDTVFGMGCDAFNQNAVEKLFELKGKKEAGLSIMLNNAEVVEEYGEINETSKRIVKEFLPGPVTLIIKSKKKFAKGVSNSSIDSISKLIFSKGANAVKVTGAEGGEHMYV